MDLYKVKDWIEFSPVGYFGVSVFGFGSHFFSQGFIQNGSLGELGMGLVNVLLTGVSGYALQKHVEHKIRIEEDLVRRGYYDENLVRPWLQTWCDRNIARVVTNRLGFSNEYQETLEKYDLRWYHLLPRGEWEVLF